MIYQKKKILFALKKYYNLSREKILFAKKNIDRFLISKKFFEIFRIY